jgi:hypothetical protein
MEIQKLKILSTSNQHTDNAKKIVSDVIGRVEDVRHKVYPANKLTCTFSNLMRRKELSVVPKLYCA